MTGVARTGKHCEAAVDFAREHHSVAVVGEECVFFLMESLKVCGPGDSDCRSVVAVAPGNIVFVFDFADSRVVAVHPLSDFSIGSAELDILFVDVPVEAVTGKTHVQPHPAVGVIAAEDTGEVVLSFFKGNNRRVED